jgi:hypothetical protein
VPGPAGAEAALWDFGLSQRALRAIADRADQVADARTRRLTAADPALLADPAAIRETVRQAVADARTAATGTATATSPPLPADEGGDRGGDRGDQGVLAELRAVAAHLVDTAHRLGESALEIAPGYLADDQAAENGLAQFADDLGTGLDEVLAARRFALTGDRRALEGTLL